jgi:hypothetical protein
MTNEMETCLICFEDYAIKYTKEHECPTDYSCGACGEICYIEEGTVAINNGMIEFTHKAELCGAQDEVINVKKDQTRFTYDLAVRFTTDRELTEEEKGTLQMQVIAQIEEPVTAEGEDVSYSVEFYGSDIDEVKEAY